MFQTDTLSEIQIPKEIHLEGEKSWWYVKKRLHTYWFHVVCDVEYTNKRSHAEMFFIEQIEHLLELNRRAQYQIREVCLVSPAYMNGSPHWQMDPLTEIQLGRAADSQTGAYVFILQDGRCLHDKKPSCSEEGFIHAQTIFKVERE